MLDQLFFLAVITVGVLNVLFLARYLIDKVENWRAADDDHAS